MECETPLPISIGSRSLMAAWQLPSAIWCQVLMTVWLWLRVIPGVSASQGRPRPPAGPRSPIAASDSRRSLAPAIGSSRAIDDCQL